jgi:hypothetical protein
MVDIGDLDVSLDEIVYKREETLKDSVLTIIFREFIKLSKYLKLKKQLMHRHLKQQY